MSTRVYNEGNNMSIVTNVIVLLIRSSPERQDHDTHLVQRIGAELYPAILLEEIFLISPPLELM